MNFLVVVTSIIFSIFSTAIMSYISMAAPIGPWVELIVVLLATMLFRVAFRYHSSERLKYAVGMVTASAGVGGIVATVFGFAFPTLYFLQPDIFNAWLARPFYFCSVMGGLVFVGGSFAFLIMYVVRDSFLSDETMTFPIGAMVAKMIKAQNQLRKSIELFTGAILTLIVSSLQRCIAWIPGIITVLPKYSFGLIQIPRIILRVDVFPMFIAIGYVAGHILMIPLTVGLVSKILLLGPLHRGIFPFLNNSDFILAFGSGMVLQGALFSFSRLPKILFSALKKIRNGSPRNFISKQYITPVMLVASLGSVLAAGSYFWHFDFSIISQIYLLFFTVICAYQLLLIGGKVGLAPMGRFATFVMVPGFLFFGYSAIQATIVSVFVGMVGALAVDLMFGARMALLVGINKRHVMVFQFIGLLVAAFTIGLIFWGLIAHFGLGSDELIAQKALNRSMLLSITSFNYYVLAVGGLFGLILRWFKLNVMLVFTGLLFPVDFSLMLIFGGMLASVPDDKEEWDAFWSGVFAAGSLWMVLKVFM